MDSPAVWAGIYLVIAAVFGAGEMMLPGSFFLLPFSIGGLAAATASLLGAPVLVSLPVFLVTSFVVVLAFRPLARRLEADTPDVAGIGANRLLGATGAVLDRIHPTPGEGGMVRVAAEEWRAESVDNMLIPAGTEIRVVAVRGTRLVVEPIGTLPGLPEPG